MSSLGLTFHHPVFRCPSRSRKELMNKPTVGMLQMTTRIQSTPVGIELKKAYARFTKPDGLLVDGPVKTGVVVLTGQLSLCMRRMLKIMIGRTARKIRIAKAAPLPVFVKLNASWNIWLASTCDPNWPFVVTLTMS